MKFRFHKGGLDQSMATVVELDDTRKALIDYLNNYDDGLPMPEINAKTLRVAPYGYDHRINWHTHIVTIKNYGVLGFTDKMPK